MVLKFLVFGTMKQHKHCKWVNLIPEKRLDMRPYKWIENQNSQYNKPDSTLLLILKALENKAGVSVRKINSFTCAITGLYAMVYKNKNNNTYINNYYNKTGRRISAIHK